MFLLKSIPVFIIMSLPLLNYFELTDIALFYLIPSQGALNLIIHSYEGSIPLSGLIYGYASLVIELPIFRAILFTI